MPERCVRSARTRSTSATASGCRPARSRCRQPCERQERRDALAFVGEPGTVDGRADFTMAQLAALPQHSFTTSTPWFKQPVKFTGPLLRDVLQAAGAQGTTIRAAALNDYKVDIPVADAQRFDVVMARLIDDQPIPVRAKGPLFIIYPFDDRAELRVPQYFSRCAWQLRTLEIL